MPHFLVHYTYSPSTADGRDRVRAEHRDWLREQIAQERVVTAGPYPDDSGATIVARGSDEADVRDLFADDPFVRDELVDAIAIQAWKPVLGALA